jgi:hypothetical protein
MHSVLQVGKNHALLQNEVSHMINPNRKTIFEAEFVKIIGAAQIELTTGSFLATERNDIIIISETEEFGYVVPHHHAAKRRRQGSNEQSVITTRDRARHSSGSITAEPIRH